MDEVARPARPKSITNSVCVQLQRSDEEWLSRHRPAGCSLSVRERHNRSGLVPFV